MPNHAWRGTYLRGKSEHVLGLVGRYWVALASNYQSEKLASYPEQAMIADS